MADYKIVDSGKLDTDLTVLADAIRQRSGTSGKLEFPAGMADTVRNIPAGADLPALSNAASPEDMVIGKSLYDHTGKKVDGTVKEVSDTYFTPWQNADIEFDDGWNIGSILEEDVLLRKGTTVNTWFNQFCFGDAAAEDVRKGRTFTSGYGLSVEGTMEAESGGGIPGVTVIKGTYTTNTTYYMLIEHNIGEIRPFMFYMRAKNTDLQDHAAAKNIYSVALSVPTVNVAEEVAYSDNGEVKTGTMSNGSAVVCIDLCDGERIGGRGVPTVLDDATTSSSHYSIKMWPNGFNVGLYRALIKGYEYEYTLIYGDFYGGQV